MLRDVDEWFPGMSCTLTALCALSGMTPTEVHRRIALSAKGQDDDIGEALLDDYNIDHWRPVVDDIAGSSFVGDDFRKPFGPDSPTLDQWLKGRIAPQRELVVCENSEGVGHVFALYEEELVDNYTAGKVARIAPVPTEFADFRVRFTFVLD